MYLYIGSRNTGKSDFINRAKELIKEEILLNCILHNERNNSRSN